VGRACIELGSPLSCRSARGFVVSVVGLQPHVESSHRRKVDQRDEAVRQMISPALMPKRQRFMPRNSRQLSSSSDTGGREIPTDRHCCARNWMPSRLKGSTLSTGPKFGRPPFQWIHPLTFIGLARTGEGIG
jgi:hypothetical protein